MIEYLSAELTRFTEFHTRDHSFLYLAVVFLLVYELERSKGKTTRIFFCANFAFFFMLMFLRMRGWL